MEQNEVWVEMWDYPKYEISNLGNVRNAKTKKLLSIRGDGHEYRVVSLWVGRVATKRVGRYVWMSHNNQFCSKTVDHINGISSDDRLENLQCISMKENNDKRRAVMTKNKYNLTNKDKGYIHRSLHNGTETTWTIRKKYGIPLNYIGNVKRRGSWAKYAEL